MKTSEVIRLARSKYYNYRLTSEGGQPFLCNAVALAVLNKEVTKEEAYIARAAISKSIEHSTLWIDFYNYQHNTKHLTRDMAVRDAKEDWINSLIVNLEAQGD